MAAKGDQHEIKTYSSLKTETYNIMMIALMTSQK